MLLLQQLLVANECFNKFKIMLFREKKDQDDLCKNKLILSYDGVIY